MLVGVACAGGAGPAPEPAPPPTPAGDTAPSEAAADRAFMFVPRDPVRLRIIWTYETREGRTRGRGVVQFVPPDSLHVAWRAPFGRRGVIHIAGDRLVRADPEGEAGRLVGVVRLFWAAVGVPRPPPAGARVTRRATASMVQHRYEFADTIVTYLERETLLTAVLSARRRPVGAATAVRDTAGGLVEGRIRIEQPAAVFRFEVTRLEQIRRDSTPAPARPPRRDP